MRCKYESFGCYECIHSSPPSGSSAIRGGKIVYCENVDSLVSEVIFFYRLLFFFSPVSNGSPPTLWNFFLLSASPVPLLHFSPLPPLNSSICSTPSHSLPLSHLNAFFSSRISPPTCSAELCPVPCGSHGVCSEGQCQCGEGWIGAACDQRACHPRCEEHGQCHDGTCVCQPGWEGEHCNIGERCPSPRGSVRLSCDILMSMINAFTKKRGVVVVLWMFSIYNHSGFTQFSLICSRSYSWFGCRSER